MEPRIHFAKTHMHINLHPAERWVRVIVGLVLVFFAFSGPTLQPWYMVGFYPLLTGLVGWCPIYYSAGFNTNRWARVKVDRTRK